MVSAPFLKRCLETIFRARWLCKQLVEREVLFKDAVSCLLQLVGITPHTSGWKEIPPWFWWTRSFSFWSLISPGYHIAGTFHCSISVLLCVRSFLFCFIFFVFWAFIFAGKDKSCCFTVCICSGGILKVDCSLSSFYPVFHTLSRTLYQKLVNAILSLLRTHLNLLMKKEVVGEKPRMLRWKSHLLWLFIYLTF